MCSLGNLLCIGISSIIFILLNYMIEQTDPESKMHIFKKHQAALVIVCLILQSYIITERFDSLLDQIFFSILASILLMHAHTDYHTKYVYRLFSYFIWIGGFIYSLIKVFLCKAISPDQMLIFFGGTILFILIMLIGSVFTGFIHGKGDGYILVGCALFLQFTTYSDWGVEPILWHYIFSIFFLVIFNIKNMSFKKGKFKKRVPFAPSIYVATLLMIYLTGVTNLTDKLLGLSI